MTTMKLRGENEGRRTKRIKIQMRGKRNEKIFIFILIFSFNLVIIALCFSCVARSMPILSML